MSPSLFGPCGNEYIGGISIIMGEKILNVNVEFSDSSRNEGDD
jgi:hypothetical protein